MIAVAKTAGSKLVATQIPREIDAELNKYCGEYGRKRKIIAGVLRWWLRWPDPVKSGILKNQDRGHEEMYAALLEAAAQELRASATPLTVAASADRGMADKKERRGSSRKSVSGIVVTKAGAERFPPEGAKEE